MPFSARPFIPLSLAMMVGILTGNAFPGQRFLFHMIIAIGGLLSLRKLLQGKSFRFPFCLVLFSWGYLAIQPYVAPEFPPNHVIHFTDKHKWLVVGVVAESPVRYKDRTRFALEVETLGSQYTPVKGKIRVIASKNIPDISVGDRVSFVSRLETPNSARNPGGFDYRRYLAFKDIWATASIPEGYPLDVKEDVGKGMLEGFRDKIGEFVERTGPGEHVGILNALIIGDKSGISQELRKDFSRAGIAHILAISGLHVGIIAGLAFLFFRGILSRLEFFLQRGWLEKGTALLSWFPVMAYGLLAGIGESNATQRAVIMLTLFLLSFLLGESHDSKNTLSFAALLILLIHAPALFSLSFQFSFSAAFSVVHGMPKMRFDKKDALLSMFWVSLFATLGVLPFIMFYYNQVSLVGLFANFVFIPLIGFVVIPLGLLSVLLYTFCEPAASACVQTSAFVLRNALEVVTPNHIEIFCFYALLWAVLEMKGRPEIMGEGKKLRRDMAKWVLAGAVLLIAADASYWIKERFLHDDLRVTIIDVGQGSSALLELPGGYCVIADGGGSRDNAVFDVGERILTPFLLHKRIRTLDRIVVSHPDSDHMGGLIYVAKNFHVKSVWANGDESDEQCREDFLRVVRDKEIEMPDFPSMSRKQEINGVSLEILWPPADFMDEKAEYGWRQTTNNNSLVLKVTFGEVSFLFPGDIEKDAERELVRMAGEKLRSTVLMAPHHGSRTSSSDAFLDAVRPEYVITSSGANNSFGHPSPAVMRRYRERGCRVFRTDRQGAVSISTGGRSVAFGVRK